MDEVSLKYIHILMLTKSHVSSQGSPCVIALKPTCAHVCQNHIQTLVVVVKAAGLVVAVGPFALDQERPRHGSVGDAVRLRKPSAAKSPLTLTAVRLGHKLTCETRWDFWQTITHVQRGRIVYQVSRRQVARSSSSPSPPRDPCRYGIGKILWVLR